MSNFRAESGAAIPALYSPSAFEVGAGWLHGFAQNADRTPRSRGGAAEVLRSLLRVELLSGPCVVPFSGGRDSSLLLAVACSVAREAGVASPLALTLRYPGDAAADEDDWQHFVMGHLASRGLRPEWRLINMADELDVVGPLSIPILAQAGHSLWPPGIASTVAVAREATGATILSGEHGDEVLGLRRAAVLRAVVSRRGKGISMAHWKAAMQAATPRPLVAAGTWLGGWCPPWLTPAGRREWRRLAAADSLREPLRWDRSLRMTVARRSASVGTRTLEQLTHMAGSRLVTPLVSPTFVAALANEGGRGGVGSRAAVTRRLGQELLPDSIYRRTTKADFKASRFHRHTHDVVSSWRGEGADPRWVDVPALRASWSSGDIHPLSAGLIQSAWLARHGFVP